MFVNSYLLAKIVKNIKTMCFSWIFNLFLVIIGQNSWWGNKWPLIEIKWPLRKNKWPLFSAEATYWGCFSAFKLWLAEFGVDQSDLCRAERSASGVVEVRESWIDLEPRTQLMPGGVRVHRWEVVSGQLSSAESLDDSFHNFVIYYCFLIL